MEDYINNVKNTIQNYIELDETEWRDYAAGFKVKSVDKKDVILNQGQICRDVFFVANGLLRIYFIDAKGEEKTFHFSPENTFAGDYESFLKKAPSNYSIQALEPSQLVLMPYTMLHYGYKRLKQGEKLGRLLAEEHFFLLSDKIQSIYTKTPLERYNNLNKKFPNILQRVPQHYIASYLNISSVHLSRLKSTVQN